MPILSSIVSWITLKRMNQIEFFCKYPIQTQEEIFFDLIQKAQDTQFGKQFDFKNITNKGITAFQSQVPVNEYDGIKPYIDKIRQGEKNVLWPTDIKWFAKSSGTTADKSKFIPISNEALEDNHFRAGRDVIAVYHHNYPDKDLFAGKALAIGGSQQINNYNNDLFYGDLSAVLLKNVPFWVSLLRVPDLSIALMDEWEQKIDRMADATISENVTNIAGVPSWTLVLLKRILEKTGRKNLLEVWPNLELFVHGGVSFTPYRDQFRQLIPSGEMNYLETYNASEGFFALQNDPKSNDMLLMLDYGIFYEFIPADHVGSPEAKAIILADVELGKNYALLITTNGGLWRYMIGDTVEFTSKNPYKIKVTGRTRHFINAFGEEVIVDNAEKALQVACERTRARIREYTAAPIYMDEGQKGGHQWLIEFEQMPDNVDHFIELLDITLKSVNSDYEAKRYKGIALQAPILEIACEGLFYRWLKEKGKLGGQHKVPRLANNRAYIDELIKLNSEMK